MKTIKLPAAAKMMGCTAKAAASRLKELGYTVTCTRCGGSGRYSYNQMDGDRCWGCDGRRVSLAPLTEEIVRQAMERIEAGELTGYFARIAAKKAIKPKIEAFWALYMSTEIGKAYTAASIKTVGVLDMPVGRAMLLLNAALAWVTEAEFGKTAGRLDCGRMAQNLDSVTACAHIDDAMAAVQMVCRAWEVYVASQATEMAA